jgi:F0F1-type ATP synthase assembly protein I
MPSGAWERRFARMTNNANASRSGLLTNPYVVGLIAAIVIGVGAGLITWLLDDTAPRVMIGIFFGLVAFLAGAAGRARMGRGVTPDETTPTRWV